MLQNTIKKLTRCRTKNFRAYTHITYRGEENKNDTTLTLGGYILKTFVKSLNISLSSDFFVAFSPSVSRFKDRGWKIKSA